MALFRPILQIPKTTVPTTLSRRCSESVDGWRKPNFCDKVAVVTGGANGIGLAIAKDFLNHGMHAVSLIDINQEQLNKTAELLKDEYGEDRVLHHPADVADIEQMDKAFRNTSLHFQAIDIIVNNAGILDDTNWEKQLNTNMRGCVIGSLLGMQYMAKSSSGDGGIIVNVGSVCGVLPFCGFPIHTMTQFGILGFTRALGSSQLYQRTGVKVFGLCAGLTNTNFLNDLADKAINSNFHGEFEKETESFVKQDPEMVAQGLSQILEHSRPGSIWVSNNNKLPYELRFPAGPKQTNIESVENKIDASYVEQSSDKNTESTSLPRVNERSEPAKKRKI